MTPNRATPHGPSARPLPPPAPAAPPVTAFRLNAEAAFASPMRRLLVLGACLLVFVRYAFVSELLAFLTGIDWHLLYFITPPVAIGVLLTGGIQRTIRPRAGWLWLAFAAWMMLATLWSSWRGGSAKLAVGYLRSELPMLFIMAGLVMTWKECRWLIHAIALGAVCNLLAGRFLLEELDSRLGLTIAGGIISNPNDLAGHLIMVLPFLLFVALSSARLFLFRLAAWAGVAYGVYVILGTASRGAMLALALLCAVVVFKGSRRMKVGVILLAPVAVTILFIALPGRTVHRLLSLSPSSEADLEAVASRAIREYLLKRSLLFTLQNPVFGVGPGQFGTYEGTTSLNRGDRGTWLETHNLLTQISSECGIPALVFLVAALVSAYRLLSRIHRRAREQPQYQEISNAAFCAMLSLTGFCTAALFLTQAYRFTFPALGGLAIAMAAAAEGEFAQGGAAARLPQFPTATRIGGRG